MGERRGLIIVHGSTSESLAKAVSKEGNFKLSSVITRTFPDGEQYVRISDNLEGEDVVLIQSLWPNTDRLIIEYCLIVDALKGMGCNSISVVIPYLPYMRQDKRFKLGEPISAKAISSLIESVGINRLVTIDPHLHRFRELSEIFSIECINLSAVPIMVEYYMKNFKNDVILIGPDRESEQFVKVASRLLNVPYFIFEKERLGDREVILRGEATIKNKVALIVDDIVSTGTTLANIVQFLLDNGASRVDALISHALLIGDALERLKKAGLSNLITTDTVPNPIMTVSVAPLISSIIKSNFAKISGEEWRR